MAGLKAEAFVELEGWVIYEWKGCIGRRHSSAAFPCVFQFTLHMGNYSSFAHGIEVEKKFWDFELSLQKKKNVKTWCLKAKVKAYPFYVQCI